LLIGFRALLPSMPSPLDHGLDTILGRLRVDVNGRRRTLDRISIEDFRAFLDADGRA